MTALRDLLDDRFEVPCEEEVVLAWHLDQAGTGDVLSEITTVVGAEQAAVVEHQSGDLYQA